MKKGMMVLATMAAGVVWACAIVNIQAQTKVDTEKVSTSPTGQSFYKSPEDSIKQVQEAERVVKRFKTRGARDEVEFNEILKVLSQRSAVPILIREAKDKKSDVELRCLMMSLMSDKEEEVEKGRDVLLEIVRDVTDSSAVRERAIRTLAKARVQQSYDTFVWALSDTNARVRMEAVWGIGSLRGEDALVSLLIKMLPKEKEGEVARIISGLGYFRRRDVREVLIKYVNHPNITVRLHAMDGLANQKDPALMRYIKPFLSSQDEHTRWRAINAVGEIGGDEAFHLLMDILADSSDENLGSAMQAAETLSKMGEVRAIEAIRKAKQRSNIGPESRKLLDAWIERIEKGTKEK